MLFQQINSEKSIDVLKRKIVKDKELYGRILKIRGRMGFAASSLDKGRLGGISSAIKKFPSNAELLALYREMVKSGEEKKNQEAEFWLRKIKTKSNSGIVSVSVLTKAFPCPGRCLYCPTEKEMPKSYLAKEPAAARALRHKFNPYTQTYSRLEALEANGHSLDKIEIIVIGGTWSVYPEKYQREYISEIFKACNEYGQPGTTRSQGTRSSRLQTLAELQKANEKASCRIIGLSVETRPDCVNLEEIKKMREFGVTKVEMGVQHLDNEVLALNKRDMTAEKIAEATAMLRANGLKIVYHMMLNLYGSSPEKDIAMFKQLFSDPCFQPDMLKIYPCVLLKGTGLFKVWKKGDYKLYSDEVLLKTLAEIKKKIPPYVRIIRVIRDIPAEYIIAGSKISNMRQFLEDDQKKNNWRCRCMRCREVREEEVNLKNIKLRKTEYKTAVGKENFLEYVDIKTDKLVAFLRLLLPNFQGRTLESLKNCAIIRELHTYGRLAPLESRGKQSQHRGFGRKLIQEAEKVAKKAGFKKIAVISGVGVRGYYRKFGYKLKKYGYMVKSI